MLIAYFMTRAPGDDTGEPLRLAEGLDHAPLEWRISGRLLCAFSAAPEDLLHPNSSTLKQRALEFHHLVSSEFSSRSLLPFRFPTFFDDHDAIRRFLDQHGPAYAAELHRLGDTVQMELHLPHPAQEKRPYSSGTEYLRSRQEWSRHLADLRHSLAGLPGVMELRHSALKKEDRIYVLVLRESLDAFQQAIPAGKGKFRISGPWPPLAFVKYQPQAGTEPSQS